MAAAHRLLALPFLAGILATAVSFAPRAAAASPRVHNDTESFARLAFGESAIELLLEVDALHFMTAVEANPPLQDDWSDADLRAIEPAALAWLASHWQLTARGLPWAWTPCGSELLRGFDPILQQERVQRIAFRFTLAAPGRDVEATLVETLFKGQEPDHRHWLVLDLEGSASELRVPNGLPFHFLLRDQLPGAERRRLVVRAVTGAGASFRAPWLLLFVAALLVAPAPARANLRAVAAALAACAAAFALCAADVIAPAPWAADAAAALAVAYVAIENRRSKAIEYRVVTAALFGLVQGMALATRLQRGRASALFPPTVAECAAFAAVALLTAVAAGAAFALLGSALRRLAPRVGAPAIDGLLVLAGATGIVVAIAQRHGAA